MATLRFYLSIFMRRFPLFLIVALAVSAVSVIVAMTLRPSYVSYMQLIVEPPQIPPSLAASTVGTPAAEHLQIIEQRLLTRANLLDIANRLQVFPDQAEMSPDRIVQAMRSRTSISRRTGRNQASLMFISFEAPNARKAAGVLNEYLSQIQQEDVNFRKGRAVQTLEFFEQEVDRLNEELAKRGAAVLEFSQENADALPNSLQFRQSQQAAMQANLEQIDRQIFGLETQRERLMKIFASTGQIVGAQTQAMTPAEQQLAQLRQQLDNDLAVYSESNPRIKLLRSRIAVLEERVASEQAAKAAQPNQQQQTGNSALDVQLAQIDTQLQTLRDQKISMEKRLATVTETIERTPQVATTLDDLVRERDNIQAQYNTAVARLSDASTGERIETMSRGQRISVIEQPGVPDQPSKPNRLMIAGGGTAAGIGLGLALVLLLHIMNRTAHRPEDLIKQLDVWPIATIPYTRTRKEVVLQRTRRVSVILLILVCVPAAVWAVHTYYLPLDLLADKVMDKLGVRW